ncbi:hypothetical protein O9993_09220 [Vibrio lentus]|nr:hypothetical protein [Vibrio lentus]
MEDLAQYPTFRKEKVVSWWPPKRRGGLCCTLSSGMESIHQGFDNLLEERDAIQGKIKLAVPPASIVAF